MCEDRRMKKALSTQQRKYYRAVVVPAVLKHYEANNMDMVRDILDAVRYDFSPAFIHELIKMRFNKGRSTNDLIAQPTDFLMSIRAHYDKQGCEIPDPPSGFAPIEIYQQQGVI